MTSASSQEPVSLPCAKGGRVADRPPLASHSLVCRWHWQGAVVGVHADDERTVRARGGLSGQFEEAVEDNSSGPHPASIEAEGALVEVCLQMLRLEHSLAGSLEPAQNDRGTQRGGPPGAAHSPRVLVRRHQRFEHLSVEHAGG